MNFSKTIFLILTILCTLIFVWPEFNFQDTLAQGDHGRDLYAFEAVYKGQLPYKDFWWVYGPIMPYYYGLFYKVLGVHISSVLIGRGLLLAACAAFFYLSCNVMMPAGLSFLASIWFVHGREEFCCTYNHIGGTLFSLIIIYGLLAYIKSDLRKFLWISLLGTYFLMLVKINFGIVSLLIVLFGVPLIDLVKKYQWDNDKIKFYLTACIILPTATFCIYWVLLKDLPYYVFRQCFPYIGEYQPDHASSPFQALDLYVQGHWHTFLSTPQNICAGLIYIVLAFMAFILLSFGKFSKEETKNHWLYLGLIVTFFALYFHEYLLSNVWYRSNWSYPFLIMFIFLILAIAFKSVHPILRFIILIFLWKLVIFGCFNHFQYIQSQKKPDHYLSMPRGEIYVGNESPWVETVNKAASFLNSTLSKDELFFALPYDCLYYYLTGKTSPTRQLIFFEHAQITRDQEAGIIDLLGQKHVNYVLISTRMVSLESGLGVFGKTYCPLLAQYIGNNFIQVYHQGGDPQHPPGWADNHGVFILRRN